MLPVQLSLQLRNCSSQWCARLRNLRNQHLSEYETFVRPDYKDTAWGRMLLHERINDSTHRDGKRFQWRFGVTVRGSIAPTAILARAMIRLLFALTSIWWLLKNCTILNDCLWKYVDADDVEHEMTGAWTITDNGYHVWRFLQCPSRPHMTRRRSLGQFA